MRHFAALIVVVVAASSTASAADYQPPQIRPPERGSVAGEYSGVAFKASDLGRGVFHLPGPFQLPDERGGASVDFLPSYSPEGGVSEYGVGWEAPLQIHRFRVSGDIDYATDERAGPWGRLVRGQDGYWYPLGMTHLVRVKDGGDTLSAYLPDGAIWTFGGTSTARTAKGIYSWYLTDVTTLTGQTTHLSWTAAQGRSFLDAVQYGGVGSAQQYRVSLVYETTPSLFVSYASGEAANVDRRVHAIIVSSKSATTGAWMERYRYTLGYDVDPWGPAFYLTNVVQTFISGESAPAVHYTYNRPVDWLGQAAFALAPTVQPVLQQLGADVIQHNRSTLVDVDDDGRVDLEDANTQTLAHLTDSGYVLEPLPAASHVFGTCRPSPSPDNVPRSLVKLFATDTDYHVLDLEVDGGLANTTISVCARDGTLQSQQTVAGDWAPGPLVRIADLNRDHSPDVVQVGYGYYEVLANLSDHNGVRFDTPRSGTLSPAFQPVASWIHDFNGDGLPDLIARDSANVVVWFGTGNFNFSGEGQVFTLNSDAGPLGSLDGFDIEFLDANHDGLTDLLLSQSGSFFLYVNDGFEFQARSIPALFWLGSEDSTPVFADLSGNGNAALTVNRLGTAYELPLDQPETGLLASADDGKGTTLSFSYVRAPANPGEYQRPVILSGLTVSASGSDAISYAYNYSGARADSVGHFLLGFDQVTRRDPTVTLTQSFLNEDDVVGVELASTQADTLTPAVISFDDRQYAGQLFEGVRWMQPTSITQGYKAVNGTQTVQKRTDYLSYTADFCAATTQTTDVRGTLTLQSTRDTPSALALSLHCLPATEVRTGRHSDSRLDFRHEQRIARNAQGLPLTISTWGSQGQLVTQQIAYNADNTVATVGSPAIGTSHFSWNSATHVLDGIVDFDGTTMTVAARDPVTDEIQQIASAHGSAAYTQWFRYDGQERFSKSWNSLGQSSENNPDQLVTYRYASATQPAAITTHALVDTASKSARQTVALLTAAGETMTAAQLVAQGWVFDRLNTRVHARAETSSAVRPALAPSADPTAMTYATLLSNASTVATAHSSSLGVDADTLTWFHADVSRSTTTSLAIVNGALARTDTENGTLTTHHALDAEEQVVGYDDQSGTHWSYTYDVMGRLRVVLLPDGSTHRVDVDDYGRDVHVARDGIGTIDYAYDSTTGLMTTTRYSAPNGTVVRSVAVNYDSVGRKIVETHTDAATGNSQTFNYYYDGATPEAPLNRSTPGLLTAISGDGFVKEFTYRPDGRAARRSISFTGWRSVETIFQYTEDGHAQGHTTVLHAADGSVLSTTNIVDQYDPSGRVATISFNGTTLAALGFDANSQVASATLPGGSISFTYDPLTRAMVGTNQTATKWTTQNAWKLNTRGLIGTELLSLAKQSVSRSYSYNVLGFLSGSGDAQVDYGYDYDVIGLPSRISDANGDRVLSRSGNTLTAGTVQYQLDAIGRTISRADLELSYGPNGQVVEAQRGSSRWSFKYDEKGHRLLKLAADGTPLAAYPPEGYLDASGLTEPIKIANTTVGVIQSGAFRMLPLDHRGTVLGDSDGMAKLPSPFGDRTSHPDVAAAIDYVQRGYDADLGIIRMGVRDYDPRISRFLTPDPLFLAHPKECVRSPVECGLYGYAANNPLSFSDPEGLAAEWLHNTLDVISFIPIVGSVADAAHAVVYTTEGRYAAAGASLVIAIPFVHEVGEAAKIGKAVYKGAHVAVAIGEHVAVRGAAEVTEKVAVAKIEEESAAHEAAKESAAVIRPATAQPQGGNGVVLRDGAGATGAEIAASKIGPTAGNRQGQDAVRKALIDEKQGGTYTCWRCGKTSTNPDDMHLGHRNVPTSKGGNLEPANVCLEGAACNLSAGNRGGPSPGMSCAERGGCGAPYGRTDSASGSDSGSAQ